MAPRKALGRAFEKGFREESSTEREDPEREDPETGSDPD
jgi:hypothetical protein